MIAFSRLLQTQTGPNVEVLVVNPDGTGEINLTNFPGTDAWAAWSPDGTKIAFSSDRDGNFEIYVMNQDGSSQTRLTTNPAHDYQPTWSPDGTEIAFTSFRDGNAEIYVMNADGSGQRNITNTVAGDDLEPSWSPDGNRIAFTSDRDGNFEIYVVDVDGGTQVNLSNNPVADTESEWSRDGTRLAFVSNRSGNAEIWLMTGTGEDLTQLTFDPALDANPGWSRDGNQIVFTRIPNAGLDDVFIMNANGSGSRRLTTNETGDFLPTWQGVGDPTPPLPAAPPSEFVPRGQPPSVGLFNAANVEGGVIVFDVALSEPSSQTVAVSFLTNDAIPALAEPFATATANLDYVPQSGLLIFAPGETHKPIIVPALPDGAAEPNEVFANILFVPIFATVAQGLPTTVTRGSPGFGKITNQSVPSQPPATIEEFDLLPNAVNPADFVHPGGMVFAPDGNFWASAQFDDKLVRFDPSLRASEAFLLEDVVVDGQRISGPLQPLPGSGFAERGLTGVFPHFITVGRDGNLWFTGLNDVIGTFDLGVGGREATLFRAGISPGSVPHAILEDPVQDGVFWFAEEAEEDFPEPGGQNKSEEGQSRIARFDSATSTITEFTGGLEIGERLHGFNFDVDGNLWVGLEGPDQVARFDIATHTFVDFVQFSEGSGPHAIYPGPPGDINLYVVLQDANLIGIFNPRTRDVQEFVIPGLSPADGPSIVQFTAGPDGRSIWFTEFLNDRVGRFDLITHEVVEFFQGISPGSAPLAIVEGPDGVMWFSEPVLDRSQRGRIARIVPQ